MRSFTFLCALPAFALLAFTSTSARAEVPQSRVAPPAESRVGPREPDRDEAGQRRFLSSRDRVAAHRDARRTRTAGIVFTSIGLGFVPLGSMFFYAGRKEGGMAGPVDLIGGALLGIGSFSLLMGIPMMIGGARKVRATAMPTIQIGPKSGSLTWTF
jgi:hypothetical protein